MAEQPNGLLVIVQTLLGYAQDFATYQAQRDDAPARVRARVLSVAAASVRPDAERG